MVGSIFVQTTLYGVDLPGILRILKLIWPFHAIFYIESCGHWLVCDKKTCIVVFAAHE